MKTTTMTYENGLLDGASDWNEGIPPRFYCKSLPFPHVQHVKSGRHVPEENLDYVRGYMDGYDKASGCDT